jgi:thioredoxin-like negative regulator of GroEL
MMSGLAALGRGAKEEALRTLRAAASTSLPEPQKTRARLAFAVALGAVGRHEAALFEVLAALASARETSDTSGELACIRLLSRLSHAAGQPEAAETWAHVASAKQAVDASR